MKSHRKFRNRANTESSHNRGFGVKAERGITYEDAARRILCSSPTLRGVWWDQQGPPGYPRPRDIILPKMALALRCQFALMSHREGAMPPELVARRARDWTDLRWLDRMIGRANRDMAQELSEGGSPGGVALALAEMAQLGYLFQLTLHRGDFTFIFWGGDAWDKLSRIELPDLSEEDVFGILNQIPLPKGGFLVLLPRKQPIDLGLDENGERLSTDNLLFLPTEGLRSDSQGQVDRYLASRLELTVRYRCSDGGNRVAFVARNYETSSPNYWASQAARKIVIELSRGLLSTQPPETNRETPPTDGTGTSKCPHWRKGHWRRQPVGPGRSERKLVWVKPSFIGKGRNGEVG